MKFFKAILLLSLTALAQDAFANDNSYILSQLDIAQNAIDNVRAALVDQNGQSYRGGNPYRSGKSQRNSQLFRESCNESFYVYSEQDCLTGKLSLEDKTLKQCAEAKALQSCNSSSRSAACRIKESGYVASTSSRTSAVGNKACIAFAVAIEN